jgi:adenylate cyclase
VSGGSAGGDLPRAVRRPIGGVRVRYRRAVLDLDALVAAGAHDPNAPDAADQRELLEYLASLGATTGEIVDAARTNTLVNLAVRRVLMEGQERVDLATLAARAGVEPELARRARIALGLPDPGDAPACWSGEVAVWRSFRAAEELFGGDAVVQFSRLLGAACASVAEGALALFAVHGPSSRAGGPQRPVDAARVAAGATSALLTIPALFDALLRVHVDHAGVRGGAGGHGFAPGTRAAVVFVDLVDSTRLAHRLDARALAAAMSEFERLAVETAVGHGGRVVKMIGDEAMIVAPSPASAVGAAATLVGAIVAHESLGSARGAVGAGQVVPRDGDYFGVVVNRTARLVAEAEPGTVVVDADVAAALPPEQVRPAGARVLHGFADPVETFVVAERDAAARGPS